MIDVNDIAALVMLEEKLRGHPKWKSLYDAVVAKLDEHNEAHKQEVAEEAAPEEVPAEEAPAQSIRRY